MSTGLGKLESLVKRLVIAWDADQDEEFDRLMTQARRAVGLRLADDEDRPRCVECGAPMATIGLCGECSCEDDSAIW